MYEPWFLLPSAAEAYLPIIASWLSGKEIQLSEPGRLEIGAYSAGRISPGAPEDIADFPDNTIAIVNLKGEMTKYDGWCHYGSQSIANVIKMLAVSKNISGLVLDIDGPGGAVNAIAPLLQSMDFFRSKQKPLGIHADLAASAHLFVAVHGDFFMLDNRVYSQAGSVGTMIQFADFSAYWEKEGIKVHKIYAPESTHKNQEFEKALAGDYKLMQENVLSPLARGFQDAVRKARAGKLDESADGILNGAMFFAEDAVKYGLADGIGTLGEAIERVSNLGVIKKFMS